MFLCIAAVALLDAASFLAATAALLALRVRGAKPERDPEPRANVAGAGHVARTRDLRVMVLGCVGMAIFAIGALLMADSALPVVLAGKALFGLGLPWIVVAMLTLLQRSTPPRLQGRAFAASELALGAPQTLSIALGVVLGALVDYRFLLVVQAVTVGLAGGLSAE